jgi:hypothetical protein
MKMKKNLPKLGNFNEKEYNILLKDFFRFLANEKKIESLK